jgi:isopropylmalate/homocitrate/citramalate synthase
MDDTPSKKNNPWKTDHPRGHVWCAFPSAARYFTRKDQERIDKPLEIHFHSEFGMGVANTINAVLAGAEVIHSTVLGTEFPEDKAMDVLKEVKLISHDLKRVLTEEEFKQIVETTSEVCS